MNPIRKLMLPCDRTERLHYIKQRFFKEASTDLADDFAGGRTQAIKKLNHIDANAYAKNHQFINGAVTHLSPYLRHGCLTLKETFDFVKKNLGPHADKLLMELARRDHCQQVWYAHGNAIYSEMEPAKVAIGNVHISQDIMQGKTHLPCMDAYIAELNATGYLHYHARLWLASYIVHHRKIHWLEAANWFESQLIDGDIASNHLSWQWVTSTFSSKPYYFNKESLGRYTGEKHCANCQVQCPFDASYDELKARIFKPATATPLVSRKIIPIVKQPVTGYPNFAVFVHDEMLSPANILLTKPFPKLFVFDPQLHGAWSLNRLQFVADCLSEMEDVEVWAGDTYEVLKHRHVGQVISQDTPNLRVKELAAPFAPTWIPAAKLSNIEVSAKRLSRFKLYWEKVSPLLLKA